MNISLKKGARISLLKEDESLKILKVGLGWKTKKTEGKKFDVDSAVILLDKDDKVFDESSFIYFHNPESKCGSIKHLGDNTTGTDTNVDAEIIEIELDKLPETVCKILIPVSIHEAESRSQNFGQIDDSYIRLVNKDTDKEIARYDLSEDYSIETCIIFAQVYRKDGVWRAQAKGEGFAGGLPALLTSFGFEVE
ncbi:TerD family protein [Psychromonas sp. SP041]|uniref:TerD family protein n=1 Tax=Psychromonas sp. SP041 TaxID=1365007 RepID=UPI0010C7E157|nr:TerD family protein [Psychromonas sp. SP041]